MLDTCWIKCFCWSKKKKLLRKHSHHMHHPAQSHLLFCPREKKKRTKEKKVIHEQVHIYVRVDMYIYQYFQWGRDIPTQNQSFNNNKKTASYPNNYVPYYKPFFERYHVHHDYILPSNPHHLPAAQTLVRRHSHQCHQDHHMD